MALWEHIRTEQENRATQRLFDLMETVSLPAPDFKDLIEKAFLEGQIDSKAQPLAFTWLEQNDGCIH